MTVVIKQICKQTVKISFFWALEALFVAKKVWLLIKMIETLFVCSYPSQVGLDVIEW